MNRTALTVAALLAAFPAAASAQDAARAAETARPNKAAAEFITGIDYQEGDYGTGERIELVSVPATLRVRTGRVTLSASVPYQRLEGPGNAVGGGGLLGLPIIIDPTRPAARQVREGVGDTRVGAAYTIPGESLGGVTLSLSGQAKLPTASAAKGLGTGEADYTAGAEVSTRIGRVQPYAGVGYTLAGDPEGFELRNSLSARAGASLGLSGKVTGNLAYAYARSLSPLVRDEQQIGTGINAAIGRRMTIGVQGSAGLSKGSPDVGAGLSLGIGL
jgi:opacity protein-like surface antigen